MNDWDVDVADDEEVDADAEQASFQWVMEKFEGAIRGALQDSRLSAIQAELRARGYRLWIYNQDQDKEEETLKELPLAGV
jgi:hypothetical protein